MAATILVMALQLTSAEAVSLDTSIASDQQAITTQVADAARCRLRHLHIAYDFGQVALIPDEESGQCIVRVKAEYELTQEDVPDVSFLCDETAIRKIDWQDGPPAETLLLRSGCQQSYR